MARITVDVTVSVTLDIDDDVAPLVTHDDAEEMAGAAVRHHHSGIGVQVIAGGKARWTKPYLHGQMKAEDAEFAEVYVEDLRDVDVCDADEEFVQLV